MVPVPPADRVAGLVLPFPGIVAGLGYALGDPARTGTPTFASARAAAVWAENPMALWGVLFLVVNTAMGLAILWGPPTRTLLTTLLISAGMWGWWAYLLADAAFTVRNANLNAWATYAFVAVIHLYAASRVLHQRQGEEPRR